MTTPSTSPVVSFFDRATATTPRPETITLARIIADIRSGTYAPQIEKVRNATDPATRRRLKQALPAFTPSATFRVRNKAGLIGHTRFICLDFDHLDTVKLAELKRGLASDQHCIAAFTSPSGDGLKAFFRCDPTMPHEQSWNAAAAYCRAHFKVEADPATKDVTRLCYVSDDPDAFIKTDAVPPIPYPVEPPPATTSTAAPATFHVEDVRELLRFVQPSPPYDKWLRVISAVGSVLPEHDAIAVLKSWSPEWESGEYEAKWPDRLHRIDIGTLIYFARENGWRPSPRFKTNIPEAAIGAAENEGLLQKLATREFGVGPIPEKPVPRFSIAGVVTCTPGNITTLLAQAKTGKSALFGAFIAAAVDAENGGVIGFDTLGVTAAAPGGRIMLHIDTEQSPYDHHRGVIRALKRAGRDYDSRPPWLKSYRMAGSGPKELVSAVRLLAETHSSGAGLFAVLIDGVADLVGDVNDPDESNALVAELHALAIRFDCPVIVVVHENPAQSTGKARGHLGSQLERKSETNLRLEKRDGVTVVYAEKTRGAPILEKFGPRFAWDDGAGMHVSVASGAATMHKQKVAELRELAEEVLTAPLKYVPLREAIEAARGISVKTAEKCIGAMRKAGAIQKGTAGLYSLTQQ